MENVLPRVNALAYSLSDDVAAFARPVGTTHKYETRMKSLAKDKHSCLFCPGNPLQEKSSPMMTNKLVRNYDWSLHFLAAFHSSARLFLALPANIRLG